MFKKLVIASMFSVLACGLSYAQQATTVDSATSNINRTGDGFSGLTNSQTSNFFQETDAQKAYRELRSRIHKATELMRNAESDSDRTKAQDELRAALAEDYDARLNAYESHLEKLEQQLADMKAKLKRRREAKKDMVELRIQVLAAEADDLGWPSSRPNRGGGFRSGYTPQWDATTQSQSGFGGSR